MENSRPTFLTVLCILTFLASAYGIFNAITSYSSAEIAAGVTQEVMDEVQDSMDADEAGSKIATKIMDSVTASLTPEKIRNIAIGSGLSSIFTLIGAIFMWGLQKRGFWIYIGGVLISIITPLVVYGGGLLGASTMGISAFFGILFTVLYYLNLKHMA